MRKEGARKPDASDITVEEKPWDDGSEFPFLGRPIFKDCAYTCRPVFQDQFSKNEMLKVSGAISIGGSTWKFGQNLKFLHSLVWIVLQGPQSKTVIQLDETSAGVDVRVKKEKATKKSESLRYQLLQPILRLGFRTSLARCIDWSCVQALDREEVGSMHYFCQRFVLLLTGISLAELKNFVLSKQSCAA